MATIKVQAPPAVSLTLGDQVWIDRNFNGTFDPGIDLAPNGVTVNLYQDDGDGMLDAGDGAPIATTVTMNIGGQDGRYEFAGLAAGEYIVEVVTSSGPLTGATSIVGATDPDNDVDGDDNGAPVFGFEVASAAITLSAGGETLGNEDGDGDPDTNRTLDFGFDQPITINGNTASVLGTSGDDLIRYDLSAGRVTVNSSTFQLPGNVTNVQFDGGPGNDQFILVGTSGAEGVRLLPGVAFLDSSSVGVTGTAVSMETILYRGGGGADRPIFIDSTGNDTFISRPMRATMQGPGYLNIAEDVVLVQAVASRGGADQARLFDTLGDDTFTAQPGAASMLGNGLDVRTYSFEHVVGMASTGHDRARLFGGPGADTLIGRPAVSVLASATQLSEANFFDVVTVRGGSAGDTARLFGDSGREVLAAAQDSVVFSSSISNIFTAAFTRHIADGGGGNDLARLFGSSFDDTFSASSAASQLTSSGGHDLQVVNFAQVVSHALGGTGDLAILTDSIGDDSFLADGTRGDMIGSGYLIQVNGFDTVRIRGVSGGINRRVVNNIAFMLIEQGTWI
ncbi:MAG: hypothetical protein KDA75_12615 [Planctomycetaceae bacterium]|nr:hypothetical protein [Planctomycetaceae bacterium]